MPVKPEGACRCQMQQKQMKLSTRPRTFRAIKSSLRAVLLWLVPPCAFGLPSLAVWPGIPPCSQGLLSTALKEPETRSGRKKLLSINCAVDNKCPGLSLRGGSLCRWQTCQDWQKSSDNVRTCTCPPPELHWKLHRWRRCTGL